MQCHLVKNVRWPEEDYDLVYRAHVNFVAGKRLPIEGGTTQGDIGMGEHRIRNINSNPQMKMKWLRNSGLKKIFLIVIAPRRLWQKI